jgi:hypothetical protein
VDRATWTGAAAGGALGAAVFVGGGGVLYALFFVVATGQLLGHPWPLFDPASRTDFGPNVTWFGWAVYTAIWFAPFVIGGALAGPVVRDWRRDGG